MKFLACLAVLAAVALPSAHGAVPTEAGEKEEDILRSSQSLKDRFKNRGAKEVPGAGSAKDGGMATPGPAPALDGGAGGASTPTLAGLKPALYMRHAGELSDEVLAEDLNHTARNIVNLVNYISPYRAGVPPPAGDDLVWAKQHLSQESKAAAKLIADGEQAVARGIARGPRSPDQTAVPLIYYISTAIGVYGEPNELNKLLAVSSARANVAGHLGALIRFKKLNPPDAEGEANTEGWLANARRTLGEVEK